MDSLQITGIRAYGYTGVLPEEQTLGQWFEVNLTVWLDLAEAARSDRLESTYDYSATVQTVQNLIKTAKFALIERLAEAIAEVVLISNQIEQVRVSLTKLSPPVPDFTGQVTVDITRLKS